MDIGECANIHDLALRADYEKASETKDYGYQVDVSSFCYCNADQLNDVFHVFKRPWII